MGREAALSEGRLPGAGDLLSGPSGFLHGHRYDSEELEVNSPPSNELLPRLFRFPQAGMRQSVAVCAEALQISQLCFMGRTHLRNHSFAVVHLNACRGDEITVNLYGFK